MNAKSSLILKWGIFGGLSGMVFSLIMHLFAVDISNMLHYTAFLIYIAVFVFGSIAYRDLAKKENKPATFGQIFGVGLGIGLVMSLLLAIWNLFYMQVLNPEVSERLIELAKERLADYNLSEEDEKQALAQQAFFMKPIVNFFMTILSIIALGLLVCLPTALILRSPSNSDAPVIDEDQNRID